MAVGIEKVGLLSVLCMVGFWTTAPVLAEQGVPSTAVTGPDAVSAPGDARLREAVRTRLSKDPDVKVHDLEVVVQDGIVTLYGRVADPADKHLAARYVDDIVGVKGVVNALQVVPALQRPAVPDSESR